MTATESTPTEMHGSSTRRAPLGVLRHASPRRLAVFVVLIVVLLGLTGCEATLTSRIQVTDASRISVLVQARFDAEAAKALKKSPDADTQLRELFTRKNAGSVKRTESDGIIIYSARLDQSALAQSASLTGLSAFTASQEGSQVTVDATIVTPATLVETLRTFDPTAGPALVSNTYVAIGIEYSGQVIDASWTGPADQLTVSGSKATLRARAAELTAGQLTATGTSAPRSLMPAVVLWVAAAAVFLVGAVLVIRWRNRQSATRRTQGSTGATPW